MLSACCEVRGETPESIQLQEAKVARASAEKRVLELELELEKLRKDYDRLRSNYANLYLKNHDIVEKMRNLELAASNVIQGREKTDADIDDAMEAVSQALAGLIEIRSGISEYQGFISGIMDVLKPSQALMEQLESKNRELRRTVEAGIKPLAAAAGRTGGNTEAVEAEVIAWREELDLVILNKGSSAGVKTGSKWCLVGSKGQILARFTVVEARAGFSAAAVTSGNAGAVVPGSILRAEQR